MRAIFTILVDHVHVRPDLHALLDILEEKSEACSLHIRLHGCPCLLDECYLAWC